MTGVQSCQPDNREVRQEVAAIHRVGEIVVELNDCGFESAIDLIDTLTKQRDAAEYRIEELTKALEEIIDVDTLISDGGKVHDHGPCAERAIAVLALPLEDRK